MARQKRVQSKLISSKEFGFFSAREMARFGESDLDLTNERRFKDGNVLLTYGAHR
jgi:hypothetical protein